MQFIRKNSRFLFLIVLPVYFYIVQSSILNKHTHVYANGIVVTHSHPFDKENETPGKQHKHSHIEICLYSLLNFEWFQNEESYVIKPEIKVSTYHYFISNDVSRYCLYHFEKSPRAPPVFIQAS